LYGLIVFKRLIFKRHYFKQYQNISIQYSLLVSHKVAHPSIKYPAFCFFLVCWSGGSRHSIGALKQKQGGAIDTAPPWSGIVASFFCLSTAPR
jgi:hypothetical protein